MISSASKDTDMSHIKLMVAEDNTVNQTVIKRMLLKLNIEPVIVTDGKQAVEKADEFDIILMDCNMPVMVSRDTCQFDTDTL